MKNRVLANILKYSIAIVAGGCLFAFTLFLRDYGKLVTLVEKYRALADAFTIPGMLLIMVGVLVTLSNEGALSFIGYAFRWLGKTLLPFLRYEHKTYAEYIAEKNKVTGYSFIYFVGLAYLIPGIVFIFLFYSVYVA